MYSQMCIVSGLLYECIHMTVRIIPASPLAGSHSVLPPAPSSLKVSYSHLTVSRVLSYFTSVSLRLHLHPGARSPCVFPTCSSPTRSASRPRGTALKQPFRVWVTARILSCPYSWHWLWSRFSTRTGRVRIHTPASCCDSQERDVWAVGSHLRGETDGSLRGRSCPADTHPPLSVPSPPPPGRNGPGRSR